MNAKTLPATMEQIKEQEEQSKGKKRKAALTAQIIFNSAIYKHGDGPDVSTTVKDVFDSCVSQSHNLDLHGQWTVTVVAAGAQSATQRNTTYEGEFQFSPNGKYAIVATFTELPRAEISKDSIDE